MTAPPQMTPCNQFQLTLLRRLSEGTLAFLNEQDQAHVTACSACRNMLEEEQALESLMSNDQLSVLSEASVDRLVKRLHVRLDTAIWKLLERDVVPTPPPDLGDRILARLRDDAELVPKEIPQPQFNQWLRATLAVAAAVLVFWFAPWTQEPHVSPEALSSEILLEDLSAADAELLDWLDVLEQWETLRGMEALEADTLATLDAGELLLLNLGEAN